MSCREYHRLSDEMWSAEMALQSAERAEMDIMHYGYDPSGNGVIPGEVAMLKRTVKALRAQREKLGPMPEWCYHT